MSDMATASWTFLTNHSHVLVCILQDPGMRVRDIADAVGITERAVLRILADLQAGGAITATREGRRNRYSVNLGLQLRHKLEDNHTVGDLMKFIRGGK